MSNTHKESDLRSPEMTRGLRERLQNSHRATMNESDLKGPKWREGCVQGRSFPARLPSKTKKWRSVCVVMMTKFAGHTSQCYVRRKRKLKDFLCCKGHQMCRTRMLPPEINTRPGLIYYRVKPHTNVATLFKEKLMSHNEVGVFRCANQAARALFIFMHPSSQTFRQHGDVPSHRQQACKTHPCNLINSSAPCYRETSW